LRVDSVSGRTQSVNAGDIDREGAIQPPAEATHIGMGKIMTTGEDSNSGTHHNGSFQNHISETTTSMSRDDEIAGGQGNLCQICFDKTELATEAGPLRLQPFCQSHGTFWQAEVNGKSRRGLAVEEEKNLRQKAMTAGEINDPTAPEAPPHPSRNFPRLVKLFPRQTAGVTNRAGDAIEEGFTGKEREVVMIQPVAGRWVHGGRILLFGSALAIR